MVYKGNPILMADCITRPSHSITKQSFDSRMLLTRSTLNGDGFGVGWYAPNVDFSPCVFTSATPAWNSVNLRRLAEKITSPLIFAHVRAATPGLPVGEMECHPFQYGRFMWMHNGAVAFFPRIKRRIQQTLSDPIFDSIMGSTDSEHCFAVFLNQFEAPQDTKREYSVDELREKMLGTIRILSQLSEEQSAHEAKPNSPSYLNFAMSDGQTVIVTRYATRGQRPASLYFSSGTRFECIDNEYRVVQADRREQLVIIASEPLTMDDRDWLSVPANHMMVITPKLNVLLYPID